MAIHKMNINIRSPASPIKSKVYPSFQAPNKAGFTLVEVLVSTVILTFAVVGSIAGFNLIVQSVRGTEIRADQNRRIDRDISSINRISEAFSSCVNPQGSVIADPLTCLGQDVQYGNSYYYFPDLPGFEATNPATWTPAEQFSSACVSGTLITNFISSINKMPQPGGDVVRTGAQIVPDSGYLVEITWRDPARNRDLRTIQVSPLAASWCP